MGKTRTLQALRAVCEAGIGGATAPIDCEWRLCVRAGEHEIIWEAKTGGVHAKGRGDNVILVEDDLDDEEPVEFELRPRQSAVFTRERLLQNGEEVVTRDGREVTFRGQKTPRLKDSESVVSLLRDEIGALFVALSRVRSSRASRLRPELFDQKFWQRDQEKYKSGDLQSLRDDEDLGFLRKALVFQDCFEDAFKSQVIESYREIFRTVTDVKVGKSSEFRFERDSTWQSPVEFFDVAIQELGIEGWITSHGMSSGMRRTLLHLLELALSPRGTVLLFDEYENSMGINCLPAVTERILGSTQDLQFIVTSHHPYVIANVSKEHWLVVRRRGSLVEAVPAAAIPALDTRSNQDAFTQLMNSEEYCEGVH